MQQTRWPILLAALAAFAATLALGLWRNDFPAPYHADEPAKVGQVLADTRNIHRLARSGGLASEQSAWVV